MTYFLAAVIGIGIAIYIFLWMDAIDKRIETLERQKREGKVIR